MHPGASAPTAKVATGSVVLKSISSTGRKDYIGQHASSRDADKISTHHITFIAEFMAPVY